MSVTRKEKAIWMFLLYQLCMVYMGYLLEKDPDSVFSRFKVMEKTCLNPMLFLLLKV